MDVANRELAIGAGLAIGAFLCYKYMTRNENPEAHSEVRGSFRGSFSSSPAIGLSNHDENIRVIEDEAELRRSIRELNSHCREFGVLGFDCEYEICSGKKPKVVLLQLKTYQGLCILIRLPLLETIPHELNELLENDQILKVGLDPINDSTYLKGSYDSKITVKGTLDLRWMAIQTECETGTLAFMSEKYLGLKLKKGSDKALHFDWRREILSEKQIKYAAKDAHASIELFKFFVEKMVEEQLLSWYSVDEKELVKTVVRKRCTRFVDKYYNGAQGTPRVI